MADAPPAPDRSDAASATEVRLWDLPVRVVHWSLVALLVGLWWTAEQASDIAMHRILGYVMLALIVFRLLWGFVGSETARFGHFLRGPRAVVGYLGGLRSRAAEPIVGHNPLGGWSVIALLLVLAMQLAVGLFAQDVDGIESGPLSYLVSYETADAARGVHHLLFKLLLGLVALHLLAVLFYRFIHRHDLVLPMLTGRKQFSTPVAEPAFAAPWRVVLCMIAAGAFAWWVSLGCPLPGSQG